MVRALLADPQEALHKRNLVYWVRVMSAGCSRIEVELQCCCSACAKPPEDEQVTLETCRGP
jgi:hypothetical protein